MSAERHKATAAPAFTAAELAEWCGGRWEGETPDVLRGVETDSRLARAGSLFIALRGDRFDGHDYLAMAWARGIGAAVVSRPDVQAQPGRPLLRVQDTGAALMALGAGYRRRVDPLVVGITGSAGKTTVKDLVACVLGAAGPTAATHGNWNNEIGLPLSLLAMPPQTRWGVFEIGTNHPGELEGLCRLLKPDWGVVTSIGPSHLEHFGSVAAVAREKSSLPAALPRDGVLVLAADGPHQSVLRSAAACEAVTVSRADREGPPADYRGRPAAGEAGVLEIWERDDPAAHRVPLPLPGDHQVLNVLMAVAVGRRAGLGWEALSRALAGFKPPGMRWEVLRVGAWHVINDAYNANPASMRAAIGTVSALGEPSNTWLVLGDMLELGESSVAEHTALGKEIGSSPWAGLAVVGQAAAGLAAAAAAAGLGRERIVSCATAGEAVEPVAARLRPGQTVLVKGSRGVRLEQFVEGLIRHGKGAESGEREGRESSDGE
jgi:UDP-N-acetylmuramoyl-tripeptide--D-alanyl-D-alanine ligase